VISAIVKYHATERMRRSVEKAMDIHGGKAIIDGPKNHLGGMHRSVPIGITVEGANILTRNLMIFGQGAIRSHPFMLKEMEALAEPDEKEGLDAFDRAFWGHVGHTLKNVGRAFLRGWSGCAIAPAPKEADLPHHWQRLRAHRRRRAGDDGRGAEAPGGDLGAAGRHPVRALPARRGAEALRG
jgi:acyl-CoA dehydrogenase